MTEPFRRRLALAALATLGAAAFAAAARAELPIYPTFGAHNPPEFSNCPWDDCVYPRNPGEPSDPQWTPYWSMNWTLYRVFKGYAESPPPYAGPPPAPLKEGEDYEASSGSTFYDSTVAGPMGEGAMMEHYVKRCLPIFPGANDYTCSFVSIGDRAFFLTYDEDRPAGMPPCCVFSPLNHPPRTDFIKHLPYSVGDSARLNGTVQGYSVWVGTAGGPAQIGVSPDQTEHGGVLFGYAFDSAPTPDRTATDVPYHYPPGTNATSATSAAAPEAELPPYRKPQSFYFSGVAASPKTPLPNAPIVSQNFSNFARVRPDPAKTWGLVGKMCVGPIPACQLFNRPASGEGDKLGAVAPVSTATPAPAAPGTWGAIPPKP